MTDVRRRDDRRLAFQRRTSVIFVTKGGLFFYPHCLIKKELLSIIERSSLCWLGYLGSNQD